MAAKTSRHRYVTKLRHCQPMYTVHMQFLMVDCNGHLVACSYHGRLQRRLVMSDEIRQNYTVSCMRLVKYCHINIAHHNVDCGK